MKKTKLVSTVCTVAAAAAILASSALTAGNPARAADLFPDVTADWQKEPVALAVQHGYVDGYEDGTFRPDNRVTRAEFAKMVTTALKLPTGQSASGDDWYVPYINAAVNAGIHQWSDFTTGDWNTPITRQEIARMAVRAVGIKAEESNVDSFMYEATKAGLIQGLEGGKLGKDEATTRAQSVTLIERILDKKAGKELPVDKDAQSYAEYEYKGHNIETVFEFVGMKARQLPITFRLGEDVTVVIDKIIAIDYDRKDGAFRDWFPRVEKRPDQEIDPNQYVIAYHMIVSNEAREEGGWINVHSTLIPIGVERGAVIPQKYWDQTSLDMLNGVIFFRSSETREGWSMFSIPKSYFDEEQEWSALVLKNQIDRSEVLFNELPKKNQ
jgi:hypothetical protein